MKNWVISIWILFGLFWTKMACGQHCLIWPSEYSVTEITAEMWNAGKVFEFCNSRDTAMRVLYFSASRKTRMVTIKLDESGKYVARYFGSEKSEKEMTGEWKDFNLDFESQIHTGNFGLMCPMTEQNDAPFQLLFIAKGERQFLVYSMQGKLKETLANHKEMFAPVIRVLEFAESLLVD